MGETTSRPSTAAVYMREYIVFPAAESEKLFFEIGRSASGLDCIVRMLKTHHSSSILSPAFGNHDCSSTRSSLL